MNIDSQTAYLHPKYEIILFLVDENFLMVSPIQKRLVYFSMELSKLHRYLDSHYDVIIK